MGWGVADGDIALSPWVVSHQSGTFEVLWPPAAGRYVIRDQCSQTVAVLAEGLNGEAQTAEHLYRFSVERRRMGWAITAREPPAVEAVASASPHWVPGVSELRGEWGRWRMTHNPLSGSYVLWSGRVRVARLSVTALLYPSRNISIKSAGSVPAASVEILDPPAPSCSDASLAILLALELAKALKATPVAATISAG